MARLRGNRSDNHLSIYDYQLSNTWINGRGGFDTLQILGDDDLSLDYSITRRWRNIEKIDFSDYQANVSLTVDDYLLSRNGRGNLEIVSGNSGTFTLAADASPYGIVTVSGDGVVQLADDVDNVVQIGSGSGLVRGGAGNDTITASIQGSQLDGGSGDDTLIGNNGRDEFVYSAGDGNDQFENFDPTYDTVNLVDVGVESFYDLQQLIEDGPAGATINFPDGGSVSFDGVAASDLEIDNFLINGEPLPEYPGTIFIEPGTSASELNLLIDSVPSGTTIVLADGVHVFTETININRDNITLRGESEAGAILKFEFPQGTGGSYIAVTGAEKTYVDATNLASTAGSNQLTTDTGHGLAAGDAIYIYQPNTLDYLQENGWDNVNWDDASSRPFREFITTIESVEGGILTLSDPLPYDFDAYETRIFSVDLLDGISLSNFTVSNNLGQANTYSFVNNLPEFDGSVALDFSGTIGLILDQVTVLNAPSTSIGLTTSINAEISDIYVDGSHNLGGGGNGYGVELAEAFNNSLSGLDIFNVRHSVIFSAWNAETGNNIQINETNRDVNFHGGPDLENSVFTMTAVLDYDDAQDASGGTQWSIVSGGGASFASTDIFNDNSIAFAYAEGGDNVDTIFAFDGGAYLNGHGSNDTLVGGAGDDILVGGRRRDVLTGNEGVDLFIFNMGDDLDRITDFEFGTDGDVFAVMGNPAVGSFDDLILSQSGDDVRVRYGSNSTVILENTQLGDVDPSNFVFDPNAETYLDLWNGTLA